MRRVDRLEFHQLSDRILLSCSLPEEDDRNDRATGRGGKLGDAQEAALGLRKLHIGPKPTAEHADAVSGRQRTSESSPCVKKVRGNSVDVKEAAKKWRSKEKAAGRE
jgi:hypothetical protein